MSMLRPRFSLCRLSGLDPERIQPRSRDIGRRAQKVCVRPLEHGQRRARKPRYVARRHAGVQRPADPRVPKRVTSEDEGMRVRRPTDFDRARTGRNR